MKNTIMTLAVTALSSIGLVSCVAPAPVATGGVPSAPKGSIPSGPVAAQHNNGFGDFASSGHDPEVVYLPGRGPGPLGPRRIRDAGDDLILRERLRSDRDDVVLLRAD